MIKSITVVCDGTAAYKLEAEKRDHGFDGNYYFAQFFPCPLKEGVAKLAEAGKITINGFPLPASYGELAEDEKGVKCFKVNAQPIITFPDREGRSFADTAVSAVGMLLKAAATEVTLTLDKNGYAEHMSIWKHAATLIDRLEKSGNMVTPITTGGAPFTVGMRDKVRVDFPAQQVDSRLSDGCIGIDWADADGWHLTLADGRKGYLTDGADHQFYLFNGVKYYDADMYARSFSAGNRPGQYVNTQVHFGLGEFACTFWFIPGTDMPIGITTNENARPRLMAAIHFAENVAEKAVVAPSRAEVPEGCDWVDDERILDELKAAIVRARAAHDDASRSDSEIDLATYELFIALWGSNSDIGAVFTGTNVDGFYDKANPDVEKPRPVMLGGPHG